jgi:FPC/CPF motif-containing protein YcgG
MHDEFRKFIFGHAFPCIGGQASLHESTYRLGYYPPLVAPETTAALAYDFFTFIQEQPRHNSDLFTFIAVFSGPPIRNEQHFEALLWEQLRALHALDKEHFAWAPGFSSDPQSRRFAFSFAGRPFFLAGLSPANQRRARRFRRPALVFNPHDTFEKLRREGAFQPMADVIRDREARIEGKRYQSLASFGQHTDASQYAGRVVGKSWKCPVRFG